MELSALEARTFAQLLLALEPPVEVLERIGRLIEDKEAQRGAASATKLDITLGEA